MTASSSSVSPLMEAAPSPRLTRFIREYFRWGILPRGLLAAGFLAAGLKTTSLMLAILTAITAGGFLLSRRWHVDRLILLLGAEWTALCLSLLKVFGPTAGFHLHILLLAPLVLMFNHQPLRLRVVLASLPLLGGLVFGVAGVDPAPSIHLPDRLELFFMYLNLTAFAATNMLLLIYEIRTVQLQQEKAEAMAEARKQLIADMSHELKTPLAAILTRVQTTLRHPRSREEYETDLRLIERNTIGMSRLAHRMLDLHLLGEKPFQANRSAFDIPAFLRELRDELLPVFQKRDLTLDVETASGRVEADPDLLRIVMNNFLSNAARHAPSGSTVRILTRQGNDRDLILTVEDEGPGFPQELAQTLFEPFVRLDKTRSRDDQAHGLGLSIARQAAEVMGAKVFAQNRPSGGAAFGIRLRAETPNL